jgi:signal transduction histidine kinase/CheY-like chemotaxis protein
MTVPLAARGRILGALSFLSAESGRIYTQDDLELAEELGRRAGLAMDNALLYQEAQRAREASEIANRSKDEFLATLSHELRTPLTAIAGWTDLMRNKMLGPEEQDRALEVIARSTRTQTQLIEDLLDVSRIITGKLRIKMRSVQLNNVVQAAIEIVRPTATAKKLELRFDALERSVRVAGDEARLQQVVWNLVANAVKFTPQNGLVEVKLSEQDDQACLEVWDNGRGIAPEFLPYVFDRFRQADSTSTRNYGGLGIGLSIVRHLVEMHGGHVSVRSAGENRGAVFTVTLPLLSQEHPSPLDVPAPDFSQPFEPLTTGTVVAKPPTQQAPLNGIKVLVVEDNNDTREYVRVVLHADGADVQAISNATEALETVRAWQPDVLISDIGMPGTDGYDLIKQIRALPPEQGGDLPAIALTAFARKEDRERSLAAGFQEHLAKPVQPREIISAVLQCVKQA